VRREKEENLPEDFTFVTEYKIKKVPLSEHVPDEAIEKLYGPRVTEKHPLVGQTVLHKGKRREGTVVKVTINGDDIVDATIEAKHIDETWVLKPSEMEVFKGR